MIAFAMVVGGELVKRPTQVALAKRHDALEANPRAVHTSVVKKSAATIAGH